MGLNHPPAKSLFAPAGQTGHLVPDQIPPLETRLARSSAFHAQLSALLQNPVEEAAEAKKQHVGLVLSERMVNMPTQIVPPMYRMLQEELQWAVEDVSVPGRKILHAIPLRDSALAD